MSDISNFYWLYYIELLTLNLRFNRGIANMSLGILALILIAGSATLWFRLCFLVKIPKSTPTLFIFCYLLGITLGGISIVNEGGNNFAYWAVCLGVLLLYLVLTGTQKIGSKVIAVGDTIPSFSGTDDQNNHFESNRLLGKRTLIKFFRGFW